MIAQGDEDSLSFVLSEPTTLQFAPRDFEVYALRRADGAMTRVFYAMELDAGVQTPTVQTGDHGTEARISIAPHTQCDLLGLNHAEIQRTEIAIHSHATIRNVAADWDIFSDFESPVELSLADDFVLGPLGLERYDDNGRPIDITGGPIDITDPHYPSTPIDITVLYNALHGKEGCIKTR